MTDCISRYLLNLLIIFFPCARRNLLFHRKIDWQLNLIGHYERVHSFSIVTSLKKSYLSCKENFTCFDGSFLMVRTPWHIVCIKRREKKNRQSKRVSAFLLQLLIFLHRSLSFLSERQWNESLYFMSPVIVSNEFFTVETTKIGAMIFFSVFCSLYV